MGNKMSKYDASQSLDKYDKMALMIDLIANRVILKEVKHHSALSDSGKCSQLIIITSEILKRLPFRVISYMGRKRNITGTDYENYSATDRLLLLDMNASTLKEGGIDETDSFKKTQMCIGIARFYIQIGNLFNAIMTTIRPYDYLNDRSTAPMNFCDILSNSLIQADDFENYRSTNLSKFIEKQKKTHEKLVNLKQKGPDTIMAPSACKVFETIQKTKSSSSSSLTNNTSSIFSSLDKLYLDIFNEKSFVNSKPGFSGMTERMIKDIYRPDVHNFYRIVTGKEPGKDINSFGDIPFELEQNVKTRELCDLPVGSKQKMRDLGGFEVDDNLRMDRFFNNYIEHIQGMITKTNKNRGELLNLLDKVFVMQSKNDAEIRKIQEDFGKGARGLDDADVNTAYSRNFQKYSMLNNFYINPNLTDETLQGIINESRIRIVRMYASCQEDFTKGIGLLHELHTNVNLRVVESTETQVKTRGEQLMAPSSSGTSNIEGRISANLLSISVDMEQRYTKFKKQIKEKSRDASANTKGFIRLLDSQFDKEIEERFNSVWRNKEGDEESKSELRAIIKVSQDKLEQILKPK